MIANEAFDKLITSFAVQADKVFIGEAPLASLSAFVPKFAQFQPLPFASTDSRLQKLVSVLLEISDVLRTKKANTLESEIGRQESRILALKLLTQLLADAPSPQPYGAVWLSLGNALVQRQEGIPRDNIEEAIRAFDAAAEAFPSGSKDLIHVLIGRGYAYLQINDNSSIGAAYSSFKTALEQTEAGSQDHSAALVGVGAAARQLGLDGVHSYQEEALSAYSTAGKQLQTGSLDWSIAMIGKASVLQEREEGDLVENQEEAISAYNAAIDSLSSDGPHKGQGLLGLAQVLQSRIRGKPRDNQERALRALQGALKAYSDKSISWARVHGAIGHLLQDRISGDRQQNQEDALAAYMVAVDLLPVGDTDWVKVKVGLGHLHQERLVGDDRVNDQNALDAYENARAHVEERSVTWAKIQIGIANTLQNTRLGNTAENQEKARVAFEGAIGIFSESSLEHARIRASFGNLYQDRVTGDAEQNHRLSIEHYIAALAILKEGSLDWANTLLGLGNVYAHGDLEGHGRNHKAAVDAFERAASVFDPASRDGVYLRDCIAYEFVQLGQPGEALDHYAMLAEALQSNALIGLTREAQSDILSWAPSAARYALAAGALADYPARGLLTALALRTTLWTAQMQLDNSVFADAPEPIRANAEALQRAYHEKATSILSRDAVDVGTRDQLRVELRDLRNDLRDLYRDHVKDKLLFPEKLEDLSPAIPQDGAFMLVTSSSEKGYIYSLSLEDGVPRLDVTEVPGLTEAAVDDAINDGWIPAHRHFVQTLSRLSFEVFDEAIVNEHDQAWFDADTALRTLIEWCKTVVTPAITKALDENHLRRCVLCPLGLLQYAPLHAAISDVQVTFASAPIMSRKRNEKQFPPLLSILNPKLRDPRTGALIDDPAFFVSDGRDLGDIERETLLKVVGPNARFLQAEEAQVSTLRTTIEALRHAPFDLLFSTHGRTDPFDAYQSALMLTPETKDTGALNAASIAELPLENTSTVFLIACESGMITGKLPEESRSLVTAFLEAGAKSVVSALWSVPVVSASTLLLDVQWRRYQGHEATEIALQKAVAAARDGALQSVASTAALKGGALRTSVKLTPASETRLPDVQSSITDDWLLKSPLTWAAWTHTGAWETSE